MKAILVRAFGPPDVMRLEDVPDPTPSPTQVLVRVHAAGVNPVDAYVRTGTYARKPSRPYVPGSDGAGVVARVGSLVTAFAPGDRVYLGPDGIAVSGAGTYAEFAACDPGMVRRLPDTVSFGQGAALGVPYVTAHRALFGRARAREGETVLVHGATGGVGLAAVDLARARGLTVFGTGGTARGLEAVRARGASLAVNHREPGYLDAVLQATGGRGVDVILEMAAHVNLDTDLGLLARFGRVVVIGSRGRVEIDPRQTMGRDAAILGMTQFNVTSAELDAIHAELFDGLARGVLAPVVGRELPLEEAPLAHEAVLETGACGKIVLLP